MLQDWYGDGADIINAVLYALSVILALGSVIVGVVKSTKAVIKTMKALETGRDFGKESNKAVWKMKAVVGADGVKLSKDRVYCERRENDLFREVENLELGSSCRNICHIRKEPDEGCARICKDSKTPV